MLTIETIRKVEPVLSMPGVFNVNFRPDSDQIWVSVYGMSEAIAVNAHLMQAFETDNITDYYPDGDTDQLASYSIYPEGLILSVSAWLPEQKEAPQQEGATKENLHVDYTPDPWDLEEVQP